MISLSEGPHKEAVNKISEENKGLSEPDTRAWYLFSDFFASAMAHGKGKKNRD